MVSDGGLLCTIKEKGNFWILWQKQERKVNKKVLGCVMWLLSLSARFTNTVSVSFELQWRAELCIQYLNQHGLRSCESQEAERPGEFTVDSRSALDFSELCNLGLGTIFSSTQILRRLTTGLQKPSCHPVWGEGRKLNQVLSILQIINRGAKIPVSVKETRKFNFIQFPAFEEWSIPEIWSSWSYLTDIGSFLQNHQWII